MSRIPLVLSLLLLTACASSAPIVEKPVPLSERWVYVGRVRDASVALDTASIVRLGPGELRVWITTTFATPQLLAGMAPQ